jgi:hypothetical protein
MLQADEALGGSTHVNLSPKYTQIRLPCDPRWGCDRRHTKEPTNFCPLLSVTKAGVEFFDRPGRR